MSDTTSQPSDFTGAVMDPRVQALLGMAGGLAQAAMPSRMPVPIGAAIGMGAQGMSQGLANSMALQKQDMDLQLQRARLPVFTQGLQHIAGGQAPFGPMGGGMGQPQQGGAMPAPFGVPQGQSDSPAALINSAPTWALLGSDKFAAASMETGQKQAGGEGYVPTNNGGSTYTAGGPKDPRVIAMDANATLPAKLAEQGLGIGPDGTVQPLAGILAAKAGIAGASADAEARARAGYEIGQYDVPDPLYGQPGHPTRMIKQTMTALEAQQAGLQPQQGSAPGAAPNAMSSQDYVTKVNRNPAYTTNPGSTAYGPADATNAPWQKFMQTAHPELPPPQSPQDFQAQKSNPALASEFTIWNARQNAATLTASGVPVNSASLALAHYLGGRGAADVLSAPPGTPLAKIPSILQSGALGMGPNGMPKNPDLVGATAGTIGAKYKLKFGVQPVDLSDGTSSPGATPGIPGMPQYSPEQQKEVEAAPGIEADVRSNAREAANSELRLSQAQAAIARATKAGIPTGYFSPELAEAAAAAKSLGIDTTKLGIDPKSVTDAQAAREAMVQISGEMLKRLFPQRITNMDIKMVGEALPNYGIDPGSLQQVFALVHQQNQYDLGKANFMENWQSQRGGTLGWQPAFYTKNGYGPAPIAALKSAGYSDAEAQRATSNAPPQQAAPTAPVLTATHPDGRVAKLINGQWVISNGK